MACVLPPGKGAVIACVRCGAYAWEHAISLKEACPGRATGAREARRRRFLDGLFPKHSVEWTLSRWWTPTPAAASWVLSWVEKGRPLTGSAVDEVVATQDLLKDWGSEASRHRIIRTIGLNRNELNKCVRMAFAKKEKMEEECQTCDDAPGLEAEDGDGLEEFVFEAG